MNPCRTCGRPDHRIPGDSFYRYCVMPEYRHAGSIVDRQPGIDLCSVVNSTPDGLQVYVLLDDGRILSSQPLENTHCAQVHAEQVTRLGLRPRFLVNVLGYALEPEL